MCYALFAGSKHSGRPCQYLVLRNFWKIAVFAKIITFFQKLLNNAKILSFKDQQEKLDFHACPQKTFRNNVTGQTCRTITTRESWNQWCRSYGCRGETCKHIPKFLICQKFGLILKKFGYRNSTFFNNITEIVLCY